MNHTTARLSVLQTLSNANLDALPGLTVKTIALFTGYPPATIRRTIAELVRDRHHITRDGKLVRLITV